MQQPYSQVNAPTHTTAARRGNWECFVSYKLSVVHPTDPSKCVTRDSWHRFSARKKSHGWCDFAPGTVVGLATFHHVLLQLKHQLMTVDDS
jgi:hypothetical protein